MPRSLTDNPHHLERDACGIGFVAERDGPGVARGARARPRGAHAGAAPRRGGRRPPDGRRRGRAPAAAARARTRGARAGDGLRARHAARARPSRRPASPRASASARGAPSRSTRRARPGRARERAADRAGAARGAARRAIAELRAFRARRRLDGRADVYVASLSFRTVVYKALCAADQLAAFYPDLRDEALEVPFGVFHQRFSTNTAPSWERAQPFRLLCHNGEINAIRGNVNWMRARAGALGWEHALDRPLLDETSSDSGMLDNALELLVRGGRDVRHALSMLDPARLAGRPGAAGRRALLLPLPRRAGGAVGRAGGRRLLGRPHRRRRARPQRAAAHALGRRRATSSCCGSEAGLFDLPDGPVRRGRLGPGEMLVVDPERGLQVDREIKRDLAAQAPYGRWLGAWRRQGSSGEPVAPPDEELAARHVLFGYTREELSVVLRPSAAHGHEPTSSMGDDTALPLLSGRGRPLYSYFRQRFAQVTNPADRPHPRALRHVARGRCSARARRCSRRRPTAAAGIELESFFLYPSRPRRARARPPRRDVRPRRGARARVRAARRRGRGRGLRRARDAAAQRRRRVAGAPARADAARDRGRPPPPRRRRPAHDGDARRRERRAARDAPLRLPARLRRRGDRPAARAADGRLARGQRPARRRPALARRGAGAATAGRSRTAC